MPFKRRLFALAVAGPLLLVVSACAKKQVVNDGVNSQPQAKTGETTKDASTARLTELGGTAGSSEKSSTTAGSQQGKATPPPGTAALNEAPRPVPDRGLGSTSTAGLSRIHFGFDQATLTAEARETLGRNAKYLKSTKPGAAIRIEGHCDERGTAEYNVALGERRALSARQYLEDLGVEGSRIKVISYGKEMPADSGHTEEAWATNRRDEFVEVSAR